MRGSLTCVRTKKASAMNAMLPPDMLEATRLTREGRLAEASALLQRLLQNSGAPNPRHDAAAPPLGNHKRVIDVRAGPVAWLVQVGHVVEECA